MWLRACVRSIERLTMHCVPFWEVVCGSGLACAPARLCAALDSCPACFWMASAAAACSACPARGGGGGSFSSAPDLPAGAEADGFDGASG